MKEWNYLFEVPDIRKVRMIVSTDAKNEADDQFAIAHHLMTPRFIVKGIIGAHFNWMPRQYGEGHTAAASTEEIAKILKLMELDDQYEAICGAEYPLKDEFTPSPSAGSARIIEEALCDDPHPLYVAAQGALTDVASAILERPEIAERMTVIWIGGRGYPEGGEEYNLHQDIAAANVVMKSAAQVWQVPVMQYKDVGITLAMLQRKVRPCGEIGRYLFEQLVEFNKKATWKGNWPQGEMWNLGDSPTVGVLLEEEQQTDNYDLIEAPVISYEDMTYSFTGSGKIIRVYNRVNARLILEDMIAKLEINYGAQE